MATDFTSITDDQLELIRDHAGWKNYGYEATMNDYTVETISRCDAGIERTADALIAEGIDPDEAVVWDGAQWRPAHDPYEGN